MRNIYNRKQDKKNFFLINYRLPEGEFRVIDEKGKQIGIFDKNKALDIAQEKELDLVLIAPRAKPPVAKIIDFKKFLYQEKKKKQEEKRGIKKNVVKDIKLSLFIAQADLDRLITKGKDFLKEGHQLRINLPLKGRENTKRERALNLVVNFIKNLGELNLSKEPKFEGQVLRAVVARKK